jgi:L-histidine Nalpha-methyltransferase
MLEAAYDDAAGVTAAFNRNVLDVLNRELGADFPVPAFEHVARYDHDHGWIEMNLRAARPVTVTFPTMGLTVDFAAGEELRTEISCKFTREQVQRLFDAASLELRRWDTDEAGWFALALGVA